MELMKITSKAVLIALYILAWAFLISATTPQECKVPVENMSKFCIQLRYP